MNSLFVLNIAGICASIISFIAGLRALPANKRLATVMFFVFAVLILSVVLGNSVRPTPSFDAQAPVPGPAGVAQARVGETNQPNNAPVKNEVQLPPAFRVRSIQGLLYSYSKDRWANQMFGGSAYPDVNLQFGGGLIVDPSYVRWRGAYEIQPSDICLTVSDLKLPTRSMFSDAYRDVGVAYGLELENIAFADYSMSRIVVLYRTFMGDTPQSVIKKCFATIPLGSGKPQYDLKGEWQGSYVDEDSDKGPVEVPLDARILQTGDKLYGSMIQLDSEPKPGDKSRWEIEGRVLNDKITFVARNPQRSLVAISYVGTYNARTQEVSGTRYVGLGKGSWKLKYSGAFSDAPADILNPAAANPPENQ